MSIPTERKIKVLLAKSDQDAHDRGLRYVAKVLRDAGMEVVFIRYRIADGVRRGKLGYASKTSEGTYQAISIDEATFGEADVEFSEQVVLLPRDTALALKEGRAPVGGEEEREQEEIEEKKAEEGREVIVVPGERFSSVSWRGEVPARQWMQFYTKVLSRFATQEGLCLDVDFKASPPSGISKDKVDETKASLRELGLNDDISTAG